MRTMISAIQQHIRLQQYSQVQTSTLTTSQGLPLMLAFAIMSCMMHIRDKEMQLLR